MFKLAATYVVDIVAGGARHRLKQTTTPQASTVKHGRESQPTLTKKSSRKLLNPYNTRIASLTSSGIFPRMF